MHAQPPHHGPFLDRFHRADLVPPAQVPQLHLAVAAPGDEFAQAAALHVHVGDPLLVLLPELDHGLLRRGALVEDAEGAVAVAGDEDLAGHGVGGEGRERGGGAGGDFLDDTVNRWAVNFGGGQEGFFTVEQISAAALQTLMTRSSPATSSFPCPCCQSSTNPAILGLAILLVRPRKADTSSMFSGDS